MDRTSRHSQVEGGSGSLGISPSESEVIVLGWKGVDCSLQVREEFCSKRRCSSIRVLFMSGGGGMEWEIDRRIRAALVVM